jgi:uncharacterized protein (TIGR03437 family)
VQRYRRFVSPVLIFVGYAPSLLAQQYCASGAVMTAAGTSFNVGDPVSFTATITPGSLSCMTSSPITGITDTSCSAEFTLDIVSGLRQWQSSGPGIPNSFMASGSSAPSIPSNTSAIHFLEGTELTPLPSSPGPDAALALDFEVSYSTVNVIAGGTLPASLPSPANSFFFTLLDGSAAQYTVSYTGQTCAISSSGSTPAITLVQNAEGGAATVAPNTWVTLKGSNLAPAGDSRIWQTSDFVNNELPTQLDGVSVTLNGEKAFVYYISPTQINILTPPDLATGTVQVLAATNAGTSASFAAQAQAESPSFFIFGGGPYVAATHGNGSLLGPASLYPGQTTPANPGETIVLYANGFGPTSTPVVSGSETQSGSLNPLPVIAIGGTAATVQFAGLISPGLYQFNVVVPASTPAGDNALTATYAGLVTQTGVLVTVGP